MINKNSIIPFYSQIYDDIFDKIYREDISPGSKLPTLNELCEHYSVSMITVTKALETLKREGIVDSIQGKGYFAKDFKKIDQQIFKLTSFSEDVRKLNLSPSSVVLRNELMPAPQNIACLLEVEDKTSIVYIERIRKGNNEPLLIEKTYLNKKYCPGINDYDLTNRSLYSILEEDYKLELTDSKISIESILLRPEEVEIFNLPFREPALLLTILAYLSNNKPIEYTKQILRGDKFRLTGHAKSYSSVI